MTFLEENNIVLSRTQRMKDFVKSWALPVICFVVFWLIFKFVLMTSVIPTQSMYKFCVEIGKQLFMVGDRIIQRKNTEQVINGDLGTIQSIVQLESDVAVEIYFDSKGETLVYNNEDMKDIELAYAITVHSSQGCEFPCCIIPVSMTYGVMLTKPLYYTGITRAKKKLVMIGDEEALKYALQNFRKQTRKSLLGPRIITKLKKAKT